MTDEQINRAIAEACGWKPDKRGIGWLSPHGYYAPEPNYCADLNAMHEAEKVLGKKLSEYGNHLCALTQANENDRPECYIWHVTARQRAEAFLRTLGKWEEATDKNSLTVEATAEEASVDEKEVQG